MRTSSMEQKCVKSNSEVKLPVIREKEDLTYIFDLLCNGVADGT